MSKWTREGEISKEILNLGGDNTTIKMGR